VNQSRTDEVLRLAERLATPRDHGDYLETHEALRSAVQAMEDELAAAKQGEPVAWQWQSKGCEDWFPLNNPRNAEDMRAAGFMVRPLFTHPAPVQEGWLPIESAPKDGTTVLLAQGDYVDVGFWHNGEGCRRGGAGWYSEDDKANLLIARNIEPDHWMRFPAAPSTGEPK
jgi:hypothetical protein